MSRRAERRMAEYETEYEAPRQYNQLKQLIVLLAVAFMVTLGVVIGARLSSDAIAVLVGVIAGVAASIPCALLLMAVTRRRREEYRTRDDHETDPYGRQPTYRDPRPAPPPVIVVTPGSSPPQLAPWTNSQDRWQSVPGYEVPVHPQRQFRVMGYDEQEDE